MRIQISFTRELTLAAIDGAAEYFELIESQLRSTKTADYLRTQEMMEKCNINAEVEYADWRMAIQEHQAKFDMFFPNYFRYSFKWRKIYSKPRSLVSILNLFR